MTVVLRAAGPDDALALAHLAHLEAHDLSDLTGALPGDDGRYDDPRLDRFLVDPGGSAYLVERDGRIAGLALVRPVDGAAFVHSFFVVRSLRRLGVGREAAALLLATRPGPWTIAFLERHEAAARFWREVATAARGSAWTEERREHGGETFGWITLP